MSEIVRSHYDAIWRFCARRLGPDRASDAAQETFLTAQSSLAKFRKGSELRTWLFGIALNHCRNLSRKYRIEAPFELSAAAVSDGDPVDRMAVRIAISKLADRHRDVVLMHEIDGLSYAEIGALLRVPEGTVKSRLHNAFRQLRTQLQDKGKDF